MAMAEKHLTVRIHSGDDVFSQLDFDQAEVTIGRHEGCDIVLQQEGVSRIHARITRLADTYILTDNKSLNCTYLNGAKATGKLPLRSGDEISILDVKLEIILNSAGSPKVTSEKTVWVPKTGPKDIQIGDDEETKPRSLLSRLFSKGK